MGESILLDKCIKFAIRIVNLYKYLLKEKTEFVMSKQLLKSGTSIGAQISEGCYAESKMDFIHKYGIGQKECNETIYWLKILFYTDFITEAEFDSLHSDAVELMRIITSSIKTAKNSIQKNQ